ncbi:MAG: hypothetical protein ABI480_00290 [Chitinophagaceae bacterium]
MIFMLLIVVLLLYCYLVNCYIAYFSLNRANTANSPKKITRRAKLPLARQIEKLGLLKAVPFIRGSTKKYSYLASVTKELAKFFGILTIASLFYSALQLWLTYSESFDQTSLTILQIERSIRQIEAIIKPFKLGGIKDVIALILLITVVAWIPLLSKFQLTNKYKKVMKVLGTVTMVLAVFTSFTFFGSRFYKNETGHVGKLQTHKLEIIKQSKLLVHDVADLVIDKALSQYIGGNLRILTHDAELVNWYANNPIELDNDDTLYNLNTCDILKPVIAEKLKKIMSTLPPTFQYDISGVRAMEDLSAYIQQHPGDVRDYAIREASREAGGYHINLSTEAELDNAIDEEIYHKMEQVEDKTFVAKEMSLKKLQIMRERLVNLKAEDAAMIRPMIPEWAGKYKEAVTKLIKFGLGKTVNKWISNFFEHFTGDNPFVGNILDPVVNEPMKDFITEKIVNIFKAGTGKDETKLIEEIESVGADASHRYADKVSYNEKIIALSDKIEARRAEIKAKTRVVVNEIYREERSAIEQFRRIRYAGRFAEMRENAKMNIEMGFTLLQGKALELAKDAFYDWDKYLDLHQIQIGLSQDKDVEKFFADYCASNSDMAATWGFVLIADPFVQQEIRTMQAESVSKEGHIKPGHGMYYYFEKYGYSHEDVDKLFIVPSYDEVDIICNETSGR